MKVFRYKKNYLVIEGHFDLSNSKRVKHKGKNLTVTKLTALAILECKTIGLLAIDFFTKLKYDFSKFPYAPFRHQVITTYFLASCYQAMCWNEAGTGKTASCIWAYDILRKEKLAKKLLIICPLSTVKAVWRLELFKLFPQLKCEILIGTQQKRVRLLKKELDVYIINHDGIKTISDELKSWKPDLIIIDESTAFKNQRTARWKVMRDLHRVAKFVWLLSGTPAPQAPTDLYAQGRLVCPDLVGRSFIRFRDATMIQVAMHRWLPRPNFEQVLKKMVRPVIRFVRDDCLDLPDVLIANYDVSMSLGQCNAYNKLRKEAIYQTTQGDITAVNEGVMRSKLMQCCGGFVYVTDTSDAAKDRMIIDLNPAARFEAVKDIITETSRGILIFVPFLSIIASLSKYVSKYVVTKTITGATSLVLRSEYFKQFQAGKIKVLIAHPKTMGHGVTLTFADTVLWYLVTSDAELYEQANSRIQRIGQQHKMRIIHLVSTKLEYKILKRLEEKQSMQGVLLETLGEAKNN